MAALVFLMSGMTVAEAAECSTEVQSSELQIEAAYDVSPSEVPDDTSDQEHGVCPHGHCHNGNSSTALSFGDKGVVSLKKSLEKPQSDVFALTAHTSRLIRPPRG